MSECDKCGTADELTRTCRYCSFEFCSEHMLPERHNCTGISASNNLGPNLNESEKSDNPIRIGEERAPDSTKGDQSESPEAIDAVTYGGPPEDDTFESSPDVAPDGSVATKRTRTEDNNSSAKSNHLSQYLSLIHDLLGKALIASLVIIGLYFFLGATVPAVDLPTDGLPSYNSSGVSNTGSVGMNETKVEREIHEKINQRRSNNGLSTLSYDAHLASIARSHSEDMAENNYFSHAEPDGDNFEDRYEDAGYNCRVSTGSITYVEGGENIAQNWWKEDVHVDGEIERYTTEEEIAEAIVTGWMNSPGHRDNILTPEWQSEGIGVAITSDGKVYATQNFC